MFSEELGKTETTTDQRKVQQGTPDWLLEQKSDINK